MKKFLHFILALILFLCFFTVQAFAENEPVKVTSLNYDDASGFVVLSTDDSNNMSTENIKIVRLSQPNRVYFDLSDSVLIGEKQQIVFEKTKIKEIKLAQFTTNPNVVRTVITFEEDYDTSKVKLINMNGEIIVKIDNLALNNDYFNTIYDDNPVKLPYLDITANSQSVQKVAIPGNVQLNASQKTVTEIQKAFEKSTLANSNGVTYDSVVSIDISSKLKLRTKYFINQYLSKNNGLLISGFGQLTCAKKIYLSSPQRLVIDLPNSFLDKKIRNKDIVLCPDNSCKDTAKIGQYNQDTARVVITSDKADKYIPVYSSDMQSLLVINTDRLNHQAMAENISNLNNVFVKKISPKTSELILSFTSPVVHSILREDNSLNLYLFNVKSYNEGEIIKTLENTYFKPFTFSLLPKIGIKAGMNINKNDIVKIDQSVDGKSLKITIQSSEEQKSINIIKKAKNTTKGKVVLDAGHGGSDYGAIREGINEKDINLDVTRRVDSILRAKGYKTALTRKDDTYVSLEDRVAYSENEEPEIFVSIHVNSAVSTAPYGVETHYYHDYSKELADIIHKHMVKEINSKDRGLFKSMFYVINHTTVPAILVEIGFLSNVNERNEILTEKRKQATAKAISEGIIEYFKLNRK